MLETYSNVDDALRIGSPGVFFAMPWGGVGVIPFKSEKSPLAGVTCLSCGAKTNTAGELPCGH